MFVALYFLLNNTTKLEENRMQSVIIEIYFINITKQDMLVQTWNQIILYASWFLGDLT